MIKKKIIFFCDPGFGILDNIIPILNDLDKKKFYITTIFIKKFFIGQLNSDDLIVRKLNEISDEFIFIDNKDFFYSSKNLHELIELHNKVGIFKYFNNYVDKITYSLFKKRFLKLEFLIRNLSFRIKYNLKYSKLLKRKLVEEIFDNQDVIIYDCSSEHSAYFKNLKRFTDKINKISLYHGSDFPPLDEKPVDYERKKIKIEKVFPILFSRSKYEKNHYFQYYDYATENNRSIGNPKFLKTWINLILEKNKDNILKFQDYIFLISRPSNKEFFSIKKKINFLNSIKLIMAENNLKLIVRLHPKESEDFSYKIYEDIFEKKKYNLNWCFSNLHPYYLGKNSRFAVSFYSGAAVDLWHVDCPTIEYMNLRDLDLDELKKTNYKLYEVFFKKNNLLVTKHLFFDLVLGAPDHFEFKKKVENLLNNKKDVLDVYQNIINKLFLDSQKSKNNFQNLIENLIKK